VIFSSEPTIGSLPRRLPTADRSLTKGEVLGVGWGVVVGVVVEGGVFVVVAGVVVEALPVPGFVPVVALVVVVGGGACRVWGGGATAAWGGVLRGGVAAVAGVVGAAWRPVEGGALCEVTLGVTGRPGVVTPRTGPIGPVGVTTSAIATGAPSPEPL
jgi:hypothetical protein